MSDPYEDWPRCPACGNYALDESITCGRRQCDEAGQRRRAVGSYAPNYEDLLARYLSEQIPEAAWQEHLEDKVFRKWLEARRPSKT